MKKKYFFRGLGTGILITAVAFTLVFLFKGPSALSRDEIIAEATQLGMVMPDKTDSKNSAESNEKSKEKETEDSTDKSEEENVAKTTVEELSGDDIIPTKDTTENEIGNEPRNPSSEEKSVTNADTDSTNVSTSNANNKTDSVKSTNIVTFLIREGQDSFTVGSNLKSAGLVDDADKFDNYLESNGYDMKIIAGSHKIKMGSDYKTIADIITK